MNLKDLSRLYWLRRELAAIKAYADSHDSKMQEEYQRMSARAIAEEHALSDFIQHVADPEVRLILRLRFIQGLSWNQVADEVYRDRVDGGGTGDACRKRIQRYLKQNS